MFYLREEQFLETENLKTFRNKDVVTEYFTKMDYIPCICTVIPWNFHQHYRL